MPTTQDNKLESTIDGGRQNYSAETGSIKNHPTIQTKTEAVGNSFEQVNEKS